MMRSALLLPLLVTSALAGEPHPSLPKAAIPDSLGVNIHFTDPKPGEMEMLAAAGFRWVRMDLNWGGTEPQKGQYDFSAYDRLVAVLEKHHLRDVFILDYGNHLYDSGLSPHTEEGRRAFAAWAVAAVKHFAGHGCLWEMWNEPNHAQFWKPQPNAADYAQLALATGSALREAGLLGPKGEAFIGPATSTIDLAFLEACFKAGALEYWDAVSVHPYRQGAPETVVSEYEALRELIGRYAPKDKVIPIISGEWGYSSAWKNSDEQKQAQCLPREILTNLAQGVALSIWYDWHDDGADPKEEEHHFGIVGHEYHAGRDPVYDPKPAYLAVQALTSKPVVELAAQGAFATFAQGASPGAALRGVVPLKGWGEAKLAILADGDPKVGSEQSLQRGEPPYLPAPDGSNPMRLTYRMEAGWKFLRLAHHAPVDLLEVGEPAVPRAPRSFGLWVYGDGQGCIARIRFADTTGQTFQPDGPKIDWKGWRFVTFPLEAGEAKPIPHWGGANDGVPHAPLAWDTLFLLDGHKQAAAGELFLSGAVLIY